MTQTHRQSVMDACGDDSAATGDAVVCGDLTSGARLEELTQIIGAYNQVTENLRRSHDALGEEVVRLQQELAGADAQLQRTRRLAALGEMAAGIAHEIRNPLAAIQLYVQMIAEDLACEKYGPSLQNARRHAREVAREIRRLDRIVNDVLTFSRDMSPRSQPVMVASLFEQVIAAHQPTIAARDVEVTQQVDGPLMIDADAQLLHQALLNLLRNAVEAVASPGGVVQLYAKMETSQIILGVRDNGPGIADEHTDRIFNPFFTTRNAGTGLGLAIVHRIADAHRGAIVVRNQDGAVFELMLPLGSPQACGAGQAMGSTTNQLVGAGL